MDIEVRKNEKYKEVYIEASTIKLDLGLLDEQEAKDLAQKFIRAADELLDD